MITLYCFHSPAISSVGFQRAAWRYENGQCRKLGAKETEEVPWQTLCGSGASVLCLDTVATRLLMVRDISATSASGTAWRLNFLLEADEADYAVLPGLLASLLSDYETLCSRFASLFSVKFEGGEHYQLDEEAFVRFLDQLHNADFSQILQQIPSETPKKQLRKGMPEVFKLVPGKAHLLVPNVTEEYFYRYTKLNLMGSAEACIDLDTWKALLAHTVPNSSEGAQAESARIGAQKDISDIISEEDLRNAALFLCAGACLAGFLLWRAHRKKKA